MPPGGEPYDIGFIVNGRHLAQPAPEQRDDEVVAYSVDSDHDNASILSYLYVDKPLYWNDLSQYDTPICITIRTLWE